MKFLAIVVLAVLAAIAYGILHDQVTARVCVEYFTIGHPPIFGTSSPTLLGLGWGIVATWWVGLPLGLMLATASRVGRWPKLSARDLFRPVAVLLASAGALALAAGLVGAALAARGIIRLWEPLASDVPKSAHVRFLADLWAHSASYLAGLLGGFILTGWVWRKRLSSSAVEPVVPAIGH